jgi:hypothetical protein
VPLLADQGVCARARASLPLAPHPTGHDLLLHCPLLCAPPLPWQYNAAFKSSFDVVERINPDLDIFDPRAESEMRTCMTRLFGARAKEVPFAHARQTKTNPLPAFVGRPEALMCASHPSPPPSHLQPLALYSYERGPKGDVQFDSHPGGADGTFALTQSSRLHSAS